MNLIKNIRHNTPNAITCLNVLCGTLAIIAAANTGELLWGFQCWKLSVFFIIMAAVADFFDGFVARMLHESHPIGADLDSLSDQVSFGVAPAMLVIFSLLGSVPLWLACLPAILPVATALRLAKFNIDTRQTNGFLGMPVPANALFWIGYVVYMNSGAEWLSTPWALIPALIFTSWMMVSEVPMLSLKFKTWGFRENMARYLLIIVSVAFLAAFRFGGMIWIIVFYTAISLIFAKRPDRKNSAGVQFREPA